MQDLIQVSLATLAVFIICCFIGMIVFNATTNDEQENIEKLKTASVSDNKKEAEYLIKTGAGRVIIGGKVNADEIKLPSEINNKVDLMYLKRVEQQYLSHIETYTVTVGTGKDAHTETRTRIVWEWENINSEVYKPDKINLYNATINFDNTNISYLSDFVSASQLIKGNNRDYFYTRSDVRFKYYAVQNKQNLRTIAMASDATLKPLSKNSLIYFERGAAKNKVQDELKSYKIFRLFYITIFGVITIAISYFAFLSFNEFFC